MEEIKAEARDLITSMWARSKLGTIIMLTALVVAIPFIMVENLFRKG